MSLFFVKKNGATQLQNTNSNFKICTLQVARSVKTCCVSTRTATQFQALTGGVSENCEYM